MGNRLFRKFNILKSKLGQKEFFSIDDAENALKMKRSSIHWILHHLSKQGYILRISKGLYSFKTERKILTPILSENGKKVYDTLLKEGFHFFISGLDILLIFTEHIPENFPVLIFAPFESFKDICDVLKEENLNTVWERLNFKLVSEVYSLDNLVIMSRTSEFSYAKDSLAFFEKTFVDLYYEVTRKNFPLTISELARIFSNLERRIIIDRKKMLRIAARRNLENEIRVILDYRTFDSNFLKLLSTLKSLEK
ncbi:hypothetical protein KAU33_01755 [Candidatus Dependentiae bacterium]|nr:hypothetical protein [Candidatus Dependentiae bacterium]